MRRRARALAVALAVAVVMTVGTGCSALWTRLRPQPPAAEEPAPPEPEPPPPTRGREMFPAQDWRFTYSFDDGSRSEEFLIADGERLIQTYNGSPYITWVLTPTGVLRADPKRRDQPLLLRYLPKDLVHGTVWQQPSGADTVWFQLERLPVCTVPGASPSECWQLQMVNRRELITFTFALGLGPVAAISENFATPGESFRKKLTNQSPAEIPEPLRRSLLAPSPSFRAADTAPLDGAGPPEFAAALAQARGTAGAAKP